MHQDEYVSICRREASKTTTRRFPHGAVLVSPKGEVLSRHANKLFRGIDLNRSYGKRRVAIHAEVAVCWGMPDRVVRGAIIYVVQVTSGGTMRNSKPCKNCQRYLKKRGISRVYYSV